MIVGLAVGDVVVAGVAVGEADCIGDTVGAQVFMRQQLVLHSRAKAVLVSQRPRRKSHPLSDNISGYIGSPVHRHMADGDDEGVLVGEGVGRLVGLRVGGLVGEGVGWLVGCRVVGGRVVGGRVVGGLVGERVGA